MGKFNDELPDWYKNSLRRLGKKNNESMPSWEKEALEKDSKKNDN